MSSLVVKQCNSNKQYEIVEVSQQFVFCKNEQMHIIPCSEHVNSALMKNGKKID